MNNAKEYLQTLSNIANLNDKQKMFINWELSKLERIKITPLKEILKLNKNLKLPSIEKKQCFKNSMILTAINDNIEYVQGMFNAAKILPTEHGWSYDTINKLYFDITAEESGNEYYKIIQIDKNYLLQNLDDSIDLVRSEFLKFIKNEKIN